MSLIAKYKIVDGMSFVKAETKHGPLLSYGRTNSEALNNLAAKHSLRYGEREHFVLGEMTDEPLEKMVTVRNTKRTRWWLEHHAKKEEKRQQEKADEESGRKSPEGEFIYEVEGDVLKVYKIVLEKQYKVKPKVEPKVEAPKSPFILGGVDRQPLPAEPGMVLFNAEQPKDE